MPHQTKPGDPASYSYGHTIGDYPELADALVKGEKIPSLEDIKKMRAKDFLLPLSSQGTTSVDTKDADSFINQQNQIGVSGGINQLNPNLGTLGQYIPQAQNIYNALFTKTPEEQEREDRINTGMMMLNFFTKMGAESSKPGATALGAANVAGADTASMYIKQVNAERARKDAEKKGVVGLASQLMAKDQSSGTPKPYNVLNPAIVNRLFGTNLKQNDKISLTAKQFNQLPVGTVTDFAEPKQQKQIPIYKVDDGKVKMVVEYGEDYNKELSSGKYTTVKPAEKKPPTTYEDDFGDKRFLTGPNENRLVRDVENEKKIESNKNVDTEKEEDDLIVSSEPTLIRLTKTQHSQAKDFRKTIMDQTKDFRQDIQTGYLKIMQFYDNRDPIGDYSLAVGYAKMIDPGSVAREGEVNAVANSGSIPDTLKAQLLNAITGNGRLPQRVRAGIYNRAIEIFNTERLKALEIINETNKSWSVQVGRKDQLGHILHYKIEPEADVSKKVDLSKLIEEKDFVFNEQALKGMTVQQLRDIIAFQKLTTEQLIIVGNLVKEKLKAK